MKTEVKWQKSKDGQGVTRWITHYGGMTAKVWKRKTCAATWQTFHGDGGSIDMQGAAESVRQAKRNALHQIGV